MGLVPFQSRGPHYPNTVVVLVALHEAFRAAVTLLIKGMGYEIRVVDSPISAIRTVQYDLELNPVILITEHNIDTELRVYNGISLIQHLKGRKIFPIVAYFVHDRYDDVIFGQAKEAGADICFSRESLAGGPEHNLGDYFKKSILAAKELLRLQHAESLDGLTSDLEQDVYVYNQTGAIARFEHTWREARDANKVRNTGIFPFIISIDLVKFSRANEETHEDGNRLVKRVTWQLCHGIKQGDYIARLGGDEFAIVLHKTKAWHARRVPKRLNETLSKTEFRLSSGKLIPIRFRYGVATASINDLDLSAEALFFKLWKEANSIERKKRMQQLGRAT